MVKTKPPKKREKKPDPDVVQDVRERIPLDVRVKTLRIRLGLSQQAFGERLGTYQAVVSAMERGKADSRIRAFLEKIERLESECTDNSSAIKK